LKKKIIKFIKKKSKIYLKMLRIYYFINNYIKKNKFIYKICLFFRREKIKKYSVLSVWEWCKKNNNPIFLFEPEQVRSILNPSFFEREGLERIESYVTPAIYETQLENVCVIGDDDGVLMGEYYLNDKVMLEIKNEIDFEKDCIQKWQDDSCTIIEKKRKKKISVAIRLLGKAANNYYHFVFDILSRMHYINQMPELDGIPIIIDETLLWHDVYIKLMKYVTIGQHELIPITRGDMYEIEKMYYFSPCTWSAVYNLIKPSRKRAVKPNSIMSFYKNNILPLTKDLKLDYSEKIFCIRGEETINRLENEKEVASLCERFGFKLINPGRYSILEQAAIFNRAKYIMADEGAALVNLIYCKEGATLICIQPKEWDNCVYPTIANMCNMKCICLDAECTKDRNHLLDIEYCERFLRSI